MEFLNKRDPVFVMNKSAEGILFFPMYIKYTCVCVYVFSWT